MTYSLKLIFLYTLLTFIMSVFPILANIPGSAFFGIDPAAVYLGNALSFIKSHQIVYLDHPGTPAILSIAFFLIPIQVISKFVYHQNSITWIYNHLDFVYLYIRIIQASISSLATFLLLRVVYKYTFSKAAVVFYWFLLITYSSFFYSSTDISSESLNLLFISIFSAFLLRSIYGPSPASLKLLAFAAGLSVANRLTTIAYPIIVFILSPVSTLLVALGFLLGTYPIRLGYPTIFNWAIRLFTRSGIHGDGQATIFDPLIYFNSLQSLLISDWPMVVLIISGIFFLNRKTIWIYLTLIAFYLGFAKFPLTHYQLPNLIPLSLISTTLLSSKFRYIFVLPAIYIIFFNLPVIIDRYWKVVQLESYQVVSLQKYLDDNPAKHARVWEWGKSKEFFALWGNSWSGYFTGQELKNIYPDRLELILPDMVRYPTAEVMPIEELCFDQIVIQRSVLPELKLEREYSVIEIPNTKMAMVKTGCTTKL